MVKPHIQKGVWRIAVLPEVIIGRELPMEFSKLTCSAKVKNRLGARGMRSTIVFGCCQSSCAYCKAEFNLGKGKIGQKRRIHTQKTKTITIINTRVWVRVGESKWSPRLVARHRSSIASGCSAHGSSSTSFSSDLLVAGLEAVSRVAGQCCNWQWVAEQRSRALARKTALDGEASARSSKKTFGGGVRTYNKGSTQTRQLWGSFQRLGSFSCTRSFILEECLLWATISVVGKDGAINLRVGRTLIICPFFAGCASCL